MERSGKRGGNPRGKRRRLSLFERWMRGEIKTREFEDLKKEREGRE